MTADVFAYISAGMAGTLMLLCVYLTYKLITVYDEGSHLRDLLEDATKREALLTAERDGLSTQLDVAKSINKTLLDRVSVAESQRNQAQHEVAAQVAEEIRHAPAAQSALDVLNRIMSAQLPDGGGTDAGHGDPAPAAVQPADAAAGVPSGGNP